MTAGPAERYLDLPAGRFHVLEWEGDASLRPVLLLHGLTAVADVWGPTVDALERPRPRCIALDQRGHGDSHPHRGGYGIGAFVRDALALADALDLERPHLVGHSMGGRVAIVLASRHAERFFSAAIVDIGPEQWRDNWVSACEAFDSMPPSFAGPDEALEFAGSRTRTSVIGTGMFLARLREGSDGSLTWRADIGALKSTVRSQRSRNYWQDWRRLRVPAMLVRGATSYELRRSVFERMRRENPAVKVVELDGVSHNVPLIAPEQLAAELNTFWSGLR